MTHSPIKSILFAASALLTVSAGQASAATVYPGDANWLSSGNSGGGSSAITGTAARSGNGSLELTGDRTRFFGLGDPFSPASNLGLLSGLNNFSFEWMIDPASVSNLGADATPALRLHIWDGNQRSELIWEGAYNGTYGNTDKGTWYETGFDDNFWRYETGVGDSLIYDRSIADWVALGYSDQAYIAAISVGVGSSIGSDYIAYADNVVLDLGNINETFNFEVQAGEVPAPAALGLLGLGLAGIGLARRRR